MPPSPSLEARQREAVEKFHELKAGGMNCEQAAAECNYSVNQMKRLRDRYPELAITRETYKEGVLVRTEKSIRENINVDTSDMKVVGVTRSPYGGAYVRYAKDEPKIDVEKLKTEFIEAVKQHAPKYPKIERPKLVEPHLLVMDIADIHIGKYASPLETGELYDIATAKRRATEGLHGLLQKSSGFPVEKILLVIGNDIMHIDTPHRTTTSGTGQDTDGQWYEAYIAARELYVYMIETLIAIADVHVVFNPSNHDYMSGGLLADSICSWFRQSKNITFDVNMKHRKYFVYGKSLIGTTHGDGAKESDLTKLMAAESKEKWAATDFRYWYCHHKHHKIAKDDIGATVEYLRSPTSADRWHSDNGYVTQPAVECFVHHPNQGQIARITHYCI